MLAATPARHDQRARVAPAEVSRRGARASRGHRRRRPRPASPSCAWSWRSMRARCWRQVTRPIGPDETSDVVERDLARLGVPPLLSVVEQLAEGTAREEPQDDAQSTYAARLTKEEGLDRLGASSARDSQPRARPVSLAARVHAGERQASDRAQEPSRTDAQRARSQGRSSRSHGIGSMSQRATAASSRSSSFSPKDVARCPSATSSPATRYSQVPGWGLTPGLTPGQTPNDRPGTNGGLSRPRRHRRRPRRSARSARRQPVVTRGRARPRARRQHRHRYPPVATSTRSPHRALRQTAARQSRPGGRGHPSPEPVPAPPPRSCTRRRSRGRCSEPDANGAEVQCLRLRQCRPPFDAPSAASAPAARHGLRRHTTVPPRSRISASRTRIRNGSSNGGSIATASTRQTPGSSSTTPLRR